MIYIFSSRKAAALGLSDKTAWVKILKVPSGYKNHSDDQVYLDISGLTPAELKKSLVSLKKSCGDSFWGIIDPKGNAEDPALFFFDGAYDYIGKGAVARGLNKKRFAAAFSWFLEGKASPSFLSGERRKGERRKGETLPQSKTKLPPGKFRGWKSLRAGTNMPFFFLFVSLSGKSNLRTQVGESAFSAVKNRLRDLLLHDLHDADALLWIETEDNSLFLVPPTAANGRAAVEACLKMILNSRIICFEKLGLSFPIDSTFALHYGKTAFRAPGKTGAVISEPVNYIFHLGTKRAETGRLTVSDEVPGEALPEELENLFNPAGIFEGIPVRDSRRFIYKSR